MSKNEFRPERVRARSELGVVLRRARKEKDLTQSQLGSVAGIQPHRISMIETGNSDMKISTLFSLLSALDLDLEVLSRGHGSKKGSKIADIF